MHELRIGSAVEHGEPVLEAKAIASSPPRWYPCAKRAMDLFCSIVTLILLSPLMVLVAIAIYLTSPGPIFFTQLRVGKNGKTFKFYKFRSMRPDAEKLRAQLEHLNEAKGPIFKIHQDPRVTPIGRILRKYSLDELPQLFNVIRGDISLVGPRPHLPSEVEQYKPWHRERLTVTPGIICLREVSGRSKLSFDEWVALDLEYIRQRSLWMDIKILFRVIPAVLFGDGAC